LSFDSFSTSLEQIIGAGVGQAGPRKHTQTPVTTGTSVIALKFNGGVVMGTDTLGSYGSLARFRGVERILKVNDNTILGCMGDFADYQYLKGIIEQIAIDDMCKDDNIVMSPRSLHSWLTRVLYNRRSKFDPLWTTMVVGGIENGESFLGYVDKIGTAYQDPIIATGYGSMIATPVLRANYKEDCTEEEAIAQVKEAMKLMFYRDARAFHKFHIGVVNANGSRIEGPMEIEQDWKLATVVKKVN